MSRYVYDSGKVSDALDEIKEASECIENVNAEMNKGITTIIGAQGSNYITIDFSAILEYRNQAQDYIEKLSNQIKDKATQIEDYNNSSWLEKGLATVGMAVTKIFEGVGTAGEQIVDGFASLTGMVVGVFSDDAKKSIGEFVKKDHVGDAFANSYESGILSGIEKYSAMSSKSTAASVFKGVGVAAGYIGVAVAGGAAFGAIGGATAGTGALAGATSGAASAVTSIGVNAAIAGAGGLGSGTQRGLQSGKSFNDSFKSGVVQGAVSAGTVFVAGKAAEKISGLLSKGATGVAETPALPASVTENAPRLTAGESGLIDLSDDFLKGVGQSGRIVSSNEISAMNSMQTITRNGVQFANPYFNMGEDAIITSLKANGVNLADDVISSSAKTASEVFTEATVENADDFVTIAADDVIHVNTGKVLNADGSTAAYFAGKDASILEKASAGIKNAGLGISEKVSPAINAVKGAAGKVSNVAKSTANVSSEILKSAGTAIAQDPVAQVALGAEAVVTGGPVIMDSLNDKAVQNYNVDTQFQDINAGSSAVVFDPDASNNLTGSSENNEEKENSSNATESSENQIVANSSNSSSENTNSNSTNKGSNSIISNGSNTANSQTNTTSGSSSNSANNVSGNSTSNSTVISQTEQSGSQTTTDASVSNNTNKTDVQAISSTDANSNNSTANSETVSNSTENPASIIDNNSNGLRETTSNTTSNYNNDNSIVNNTTNNYTTNEVSEVSNPVASTPTNNSHQQVSTVSSNSKPVVTTSSTSGNIGGSEVKNVTSNSNVGATNSSISSKVTSSTTKPSVPTSSGSGSNSGSYTINGVPSTSKSSGVIPVVLGATAIGAAGIGTKIYLDKRKNSNSSNNENSDDYNFSNGEWPEEDTSYSEINKNQISKIEETENKETGMEE